MEKIKSLIIITCISVSIIFSSCEKTEINKENNSCCANSEIHQMRMAMQEDGYIEVESISIEKIECYFEAWDKTIITPVAGLFNYYNQNNDWVASIDFGDGNCDQWGIKSWDTNIFPNNPEGILEFSLFE
ncbi:MAG: hypothetical protein CMP49_05345 [Flavobacteriales bacterium]|jgi:uncharacterized protein YqkB|nr:hypothetical protein [Flavobacteriales bacterium]|tara:strand:+ start:2091 stop:2480 length:390 start_codon:yes stop_codon:yes gene_type:complete